jgi:DNA polymerase-3 subunit delta'
MPHAYIFHGPDGVGKEMLAGRLSRLLLCPNRIAVEPPAGVASVGDSITYHDACEACEDCTLTAAGTHPDLHRVYRELNKFHPDTTIRNRKAVDLGVDVVRHFLIDAAATKPVRGQAKVFVIPEAERMSIAAQNALLKTLEEPPPTTYLLLLVRSMDRLLPTTRSRCQPVPFQLLPVAFVAERIRAERADVDPPVAEYVASLTGGRLGAAFAAIDDGYHEIKTSLGKRLVALAPGDALALSKSLLDTGKKLAEKAKERNKNASDTELTRVGLRALITMTAEFYRDALRRAAGATEGMTNADQAALIATLAQRTGTIGADAAIKHLTQAESNLDRNANVQLAIDALSIGLCRANRA